MRTSSQRILGFGLVLVCIAFLASCTSSPYSRSTGEYAGDKTLAAQIEAQLAADKETKAMQVNVEAFRGTVQLSGFVDTERSKERAGEIARSVKGAEEVVNDIIVKEPPQR